MPPVSRSGASLPELLVALTLTGVVAAGALGFVRHVQATYRAEALEIDRSQSLRVAAAVLPAELRELDAADGDLVAMERTALTIRAPRQLAVLCRAPRFTDPPMRATLTLRGAPRFGVRDFNPRTDSLWVFYEGDPGTRNDDGWMRFSIDTLGPAGCPDGRPATMVSGAVWPAAGQRLGTGTIPSGAPALGFETVTYRLYRSSSDGQWYVGLQTAGGLQPLLGPVTNDGLTFGYFDSGGVPTPDPTRVGLIEVRVRARTVEPVRTPDHRLVYPLDSLVTVVALRNNRRF
jgi:hypothetical protein